VIHFVIKNLNGMGLCVRCILNVNINKSKDDTT